MKLGLWILVMLFCGCVWASPPGEQVDYNINVHVTASRTVRHSEDTPPYQYLEVTIEGKKYELESLQAVRGLLLLGDYKARLVAEENAKHYNSLRVYEFQLSDKGTRQFSVVGQLE
jgi:hypothetical protein